MIISFLTITPFSSS